MTREKSSELHWFRTVFTRWLAPVIVGAIALVFVVYGVFSPKATRGVHEGAVAGMVDGKPITRQEFSRTLNQRIEFFKNMAGGTLSEEQIKAFRIRESVFSGIVTQKMMTLEAKKTQLLPTVDELKKRVMEEPAFKKNGAFDTPTYKAVLSANGYTPARFEDMIQEGLIQEKWREFFKRRAVVFEAEAMERFSVEEEQRGLKFVILDSTTAERGDPITEAQIDAFLKEPEKKERVKAAFERGSDFVYKGQTLEKAQRTIARQMILESPERTEAYRKINEKLAEQVRGLLVHTDKTDAQINELLKRYGVTVKKTGLLSRDESKLNLALGGHGPFKDLAADMFSSAQPIATAHGGKAKQYPVAGGFLVAVVIEQKVADLTAYAAKRAELMERISREREMKFFEEWSKSLKTKYEVVPNPEVIGG